MPFYNQTYRSVLSTLLVLSAQSLASPALTEQDLNIIDKSKDIIEQAKDNASANSIVADSLVDERLKEELMDIRRHADRLNQAVQEQAHSLIDQDTPQQYIDFDQLQSVIRDTPTEFQAQLQDQQQHWSNPGDEFAVPVPLSDNDNQATNTQDLIPDYNKKPGMKEPNKVLWIFISSSMPEYEIKKALEMAAEWGGRVIYKGLRPEDHSINDMMRGVFDLKRRLLRAKETMRSEAETLEQLSVIDTAGIYVDPMAFDRFQINEVPSMVYERKRQDGSKFFGKVKGLISPNFLQSETEYAMSDPDHKENVLLLGEMSQVYGIVERSIIEESKDRMRRIDWRREQEKAVERYWQNHKFVSLPPSLTDKQYEFDPSVVVTKDVLATNGVVLARTGEVINPLKPFKGEDIVPVHTTIYVFDATDEKEVEFVKVMMTSKSRGQIKLLATRIDKEKGFKHLTELNRYFVYDVKLLTQDIVDRFHIQATPTRLMSTDDGVFQVNEYSPSSVFSNTFNLKQKTDPSSTQ